MSTEFKDLIESILEHFDIDIGDEWEIKHLLESGALSPKQENVISSWLKYNYKR